MNYDLSMEEKRRYDLKRLLLSRYTEEETKQILNRDSDTQPTIKEG